MKLAKSQLKQIIKEELEAVLGESDLGLEGYNVQYDSLRPGTGDPMWTQDGKLVAWQSKLHTDLLRRRAGAGEAWSGKCEEYLQNDKGI